MKHHETSIIQPDEADSWNLRTDVKSRCSLESTPLFLRGLTPEVGRFDPGPTPRKDHISPVR